MSLFINEIDLFCLQLTQEDFARRKRKKEKKMFGSLKTPSIFSEGIPHMYQFVPTKVKRKAKTPRNVVCLYGKIFLILFISS